MNEQDAKLLKTCQVFQFRLEEPGLTAPEQADAVRSLMFQLHHLLDSGKLSSEQYQNVIGQYEKLYSNIVDEQDESKGLNNYAEQAIDLARGFKNDSKNWKSSLTFESLDELGISKIKDKDYQNKRKKEVESWKGLNIQQIHIEQASSSNNDVHFKRQPPVQMKTSNGTTERYVNQPKQNYPMEDQRDEETEASDDIEFVTARQQFKINERKRGKNENMGSYGESKKSLGYRRGPSNRFVPPVRRNDDSCHSTKEPKRSTSKSKDTSDVEEVTDERLKGIEPRMIELINNEIMDHGPPVEWHDIAGLEFAKTVIKEIVVWPMLRPDIFKGLRGPPKGLLLFGPPGTGKTLIGKCIASQSKATFFSISASSLTSKWVGEGEKMVRALFAVARCHQPAVIFIDEIDSLLSQRCDGEHDSSRRIKTEFLIQLDGAATNSDDRLLVVGATNRPQEIDEAARRRMVKRLYIPLPEGDARQQIITNLLKEQCYSLSEEDFTKLVEKSEGYSGSDMSNLCREAALGPIRSISGNIQAITSDQVRPIIFTDFENAFKQVRASVSLQDLNLYVQWNEQFGSGH